MRRTLCDANKGRARLTEEMLSACEYAGGNSKIVYDVVYADDRGVSRCCADDRDIVLLFADRCADDRGINTCKKNMHSVVLSLCSQDCHCNQIPLFTSLPLQSIPKAYTNHNVKTYASFGRNSKITIINSKLANHIRPS